MSELRIKSDAAEMLAEEIDISDVVDAIGLKRKGKKFLICPGTMSGKHNDRNIGNCCILSRNNVVKCYSCGRTFSVVGLLMESGKTFQESVSMLAEMTGHPDRFYESAGRSGKKSSLYLSKQEREVIGLKNGKLFSYYPCKRILEDRAPHQVPDPVTIEPLQYVIQHADYDDLVLNSEEEQKLLARKCAVCSYIYFKEAMERLSLTGGWQNYMQFLGYAYGTERAQSYGNSLYGDFRAALMERLEDIKTLAVRKLFRSEEEFLQAVYEKSQSGQYLWEDSKAKINKNSYPRRKQTLPPVTADEVYPEFLYEGLFSERVV